MEATETNTHPTQTSMFRELGGGVAAALALLSASCCIIPMLLTIVGLGGAWLSILGVFVAYRMFILIGVSLLVLWLWWSVLKTRPKKRGMIMAGVATFAAIFGWTAPLWEWEVTGALMDIWTGRP